MYRRFIVVAFLLLSFMFLSVNGLAIGTLSGDFDGYNEAPDEYVPNKNRKGSFGLADPEGKFMKELVRIDPATPPGRKGPNNPHYHDSRFSKGNNHKSLDKWPWIYKKQVK